MLSTLLVPAGATIVLWADDTLDRDSGRKIAATGCCRGAVRSSKGHVIRCFGLKWVAMMLLAYALEPATMGVTLSHGVGLAGGAGHTTPA
jgi:hypothetical protein